MKKVLFSFCILVTIAMTLSACDSGSNSKTADAVSEVEKPTPVIDTEKPEMTSPLDKIKTDPAFKPANQNDAGSGTDAGNITRSAFPIEVNKAYQGIVGGPDDPMDVYSFEKPSGKKAIVSYSTDATANSMNVQVFENLETEIWAQFDMPESSNVTYEIPKEKSGTFFILPGAFIGGKYKIEVKVQ